MIVYILVLALSFLVPEYRTDVGKLIPVELLYLYREGEQIVIETDTGNRGQGESMDGAIENLKECAPGEVFLGTADYLLIGNDAADLLGEISSRLKGDIWVCRAEKELDLAEAARYLAVHKPAMTLRAANGSDLVEHLTEYKGQMILQKNEIYA